MQQNSKPVNSTIEINSQCSKFEEILLKFFAGPQNQKPTAEIKRKRLCKEAEIITNDDYMRKKEEELKNKKVKLDVEGKIKPITAESLKKKRLTKKEIEKLVENLSDSSGGEWDEHGDDSEEDVEDDFLETVQSVEVSDWVLVEYQGRKSNLYYAGCVTALEGSEITVNFLKKRNKQYAYPDQKDEDNISIDRVKKMLPSPEVRRGYYNFKIKFPNNLHLV